MIKQLNASLEKHLNMLQEPIMKYPWEKSEYYAVWLSQTFYYARHTTRLLALAGALCPQDSNEFHQRFLEHAREEKGHEKLLTNDLNYMGTKPEDFPEFASSAALYQTQYYWIQNDSPMSFFGYVLALEAMGAKFGPALKDKIESSYSPKGTHFVKVHSAEDIDHTQKALEKIGKLPENELKKVIFNMEQTFTHYQTLLKDCSHYAMQAKKQAA